MEANPNSSLNIWRVLGLALFLRVLLPTSAYFYTRDSTIFYTGDSAQYIVPARELVAHHRFFSDGSSEARIWNSPVAPAPDIIRTPGYPLLLTVGLLVGRLALTTIALQILLSCFTVYMVYQTADLLFENERIALIAAMLYAIEPLAVLFSSLLSTETMFTAILVVGLYYLVRYLRRQSRTDLLASAGALAASVYVRPVGYFLPLIVAIELGLWMLFAGYQNKSRLLADLTVFMVVSFALTGLWCIRNEIVSDYSGFSSVFGDDMYCNMAASILATNRHLSYSEMQDRLGCYDLGIYFQDHPKQKAEPLRDIVKYQRDAAMLIFIRNPLTFVGIYFEGVIRGIFDPLSTEFVRFFALYPKDGGLLETAVDDGIIKTLEVLFRNRLLASTTVVLLLVQLMYLTSACLALFKTPLRDPAILIVLVTMVYYLALPGGPSDWGRYRHPAMPIMCILASYGLCAPWREMSRHLSESSAQIEPEVVTKTSPSQMTGQRRRRQTARG